VQRVVEPEWLDELPAEDPRAISARRDLRRINTFMGNEGLMTRAIARVWRGRDRLQMAEVGCGDGDFLCRVAHRLSGLGYTGRVLLVDRASAPAPELKERFARAGWAMEWIRGDAFAWLHHQSEGSLDVLAANLFLHQFQDAQLRDLLKRYAHAAKSVVALEPRRWRPAVMVSRLTGLIGCNAVTRHDAVVSVRAGFAHHELSRLWPEATGWRLEESSPNWASHRFVAVRESIG
jgi:SAM-dependent methyltransferase